MELKDLAGMHELTGVDEDAAVVKDWLGNDRVANCLNFTLDGKTYSAIEDESDGYRSSMSEIVVTDRKLSNTFAPIKVLAGMQANKYNDILELRDTKNGKVILSVGTDNEDNWYPLFVASWVPENASVNEDV